MVSLENSGPIALSFLLMRLKWPVAFTRWRAAKEIRDLINHAPTRGLSTKALLDYLNNCKTDSEVIEILTIIFLTSSEARPSHKEVIARIHCSSILSDLLLEKIYGDKGSIGGWDNSHAGAAPVDFHGESYFEEHKGAHVPPVFASKLSRLEWQTGYPFLQQWAYEWKVLRDKLGTHYTRYPHYFDDPSDIRAGIVGQFWQRMRDVYLSAFLRTFAYAVTVWKMPLSTAQHYCADMIPGISGLFDVELVTRPSWLLNFPELFCNQGADFGPLLRDLLVASQGDGQVLVSLDTPIASTLHKFAKLTITTHLVTPEYELPSGGFLFEKMPQLPILNTLELKTSPLEITLEDACTKGKVGDEVAVCTSLFPMPFGTWQSDFFGPGLGIPAPYTVSGTSVRCTSHGIECIASDGKTISRTQIWNDDWTPSYPKGGSTRCGTVTKMEKKLLDEISQTMGRKLAFFVRLSVWEREKEYSEYTLETRDFFYVDNGVEEN